MSQSKSIRRDGLGWKGIAHSNKCFSSPLDDLRTAVAARSGWFPSSSSSFFSAIYHEIEQKAHPATLRASLSLSLAFLLSLQLTHPSSFQIGGELQMHKHRKAKPEFLRREKADKRVKKHLKCKYSSSSSRLKQ